MSDSIAPAYKAHSRLSRLFAAAGFAGGEDGLYWIGGLPCRVRASLDPCSGRRDQIGIPVAYGPHAEPHGVFNTRAQLWGLVCADHSVWLANVERLKAFLRGHGVMDLRLEDGDTQEFFMVCPRTVLLPSCFRRADDLTPDELHDLVQELLQGEENHVSC